jgi:hypothetical protein
MEIPLTHGCEDAYVGIRVIRVRHIVFAFRVLASTTKHFKWINF